MCFLYCVIEIDKKGWRKFLDIKFCVLLFRTENSFSLLVATRVQGYFGSVSFFFFHEFYFNPAKFVSCVKND